VSWHAETDEIIKRRELADQHGGAEAVRRHHDAGKLTIRERIARLTDRDSFQEVGKLAGQAAYAQDGTLSGFRPMPYVMGLAKIDGRPVAIGGEDFTVRGGTGMGDLRRKGGQGGFIEDLAYEYRIPLINLIDGAGGSVASSKRRGYSVFPGLHGFERCVELLACVPVVSAVVGTAAGGPAGRAILAHWSVMVKGQSQIFAAGPPVVERSLGEQVTKEELGGAHVAVDIAGTVDNAVASEEACFHAIKRFLSYLPQNVWAAPPVTACGDSPLRREEALLDIVPRDRRKPYNMRKLIALVVDRESVFEIQPSYGRAVITCLARMSGYVVGIIANNPLVNGGAMDSKAARKQIRFMELCDTFHIPMVFLVDVPGFMVGTHAEQLGTLRDGMRAVYVAMQASVPIFTVVIRKCYGMAGMATCDKNQLDFKIAWPSAEWGSLPIEGGVAAAYRREIAGAEDPAQRLHEIEEELRRYASPFRTAEAFAVEDIIDPRDTRAYLCRFIEAAQTRIATSLGPKHKTGVRP